MNKYHNDKVVVDGIKFDSKKEARRYCELKLLLKAGKIADLKRQVKFVLIPAQRDEKSRLIERECSYIADFVYYDKSKDRVVVEDSKGIKTKEYVIKKKLMLYIHGTRIEDGL